MGFCRIVYALLSLVGPLDSKSAWAMPSQVILIRHAEKPESGPHLSAEGYERAKALVNYFLKTPRFASFGPPKGLIACATEGKSLRSIETLTPTSNRLKIAIETRFTREEYQEAAEWILSEPAFDQQTVVIAWQHTRILPFVRALGGEPPLSEWPDEVFNKTILIRFKPRKTPQVELLNQCLLPNDCNDYSRHGPRTSGSTPKA